ncbi:MAG: hypothetical protein ACTS43_01935 [Candidatus Hodgkinia cicadicola]
MVVDAEHEANNLQTAEVQGITIRFNVECRDCGNSTSPKRGRNRP